MFTIHDPKKVIVGTSKLGLNPSKETTSQIAKEYDAIVAVNAGSHIFDTSEENSINENITPDGVIFHDGKVVYNNIQNKTDEINIVGINNDGNLIIGKYTLEQLNSLGIKEAIGNKNIVNEEVDKNTQSMVTTVGEQLIANGEALKINSSDIDAVTAIGQKRMGQ